MDKNRITGVIKQCKGVVKTVVGRASTAEPRAKVVLKQPITLTGTDRLAIYSTIEDQEVIFAVAQNGGPTEIREFEGKSSLGCLPDHSEISLTKSPGGPLGTLLVVLGQGTIHKEH